jgi:hypothetical protein
LKLQISLLPETISYTPTSHNTANNYLIQSSSVFSLGVLQVENLYDGCYLVI